MDIEALTWAILEKTLKGLFLRLLGFLLLREEQPKRIFFEWIPIVAEVLVTSEFRKRMLIEHHKGVSVFEHSVAVSFIAFLIARRFCDSKMAAEAAIAGILHDFYERAWRFTEELQGLDPKHWQHLRAKTKTRLFEKHAFSHPREGARNAIREFAHLLNGRIVDAVLCHMFPLVWPFRAPKYRLGWILTLADKLISLGDISSPGKVLDMLGLRPSKHP
jgi:uncharacterized protein